MPLRKSNPPPTNNITQISSIEPTVPTDTSPPTNITAPKISHILIPSIGGIVGLSSGSIIQHFTNLPTPLYFSCFITGISCLIVALPHIAVAFNYFLKSITSYKDAAAQRANDDKEAELNREIRKLDAELERENRKLDAELERENKKLDAQLARETKEKAIEANRALCQKDTSMRLDAKEALLKQLNDSLSVIIPTLTSDENYNRRAEAVLQTIAQEGGNRQSDPETLQIYQELLNYNQLAPIIQMIDEISSLQDDDFTNHLQY